MLLTGAQAADISYSWPQALSDLGQIAPIAALTGFMLFGILADLVLPKHRRGGVVAMIAVTGFTYALGTAIYRWVYALGGSAYYGYATGDNFALFFEMLFAILGILTVAASHSYLRRRGMLESEFHILIMAAVIGRPPPSTFWSAASPARSSSMGWRSYTAAPGPHSFPASPRRSDPPRRATPCCCWGSC